MNPLISIIVPTRDRPHYLENALSSLKLQTYQNFEVIVCDNYSKLSGREAFNRQADSRFSYIKPDRTLNMCDNWELGVSRAKGQLVGVLIDKTFLVENALEVAVNNLKQVGADFVTWGNGAFVPTDETLRTSTEGQLIIGDEEGAPYLIDLKSELKRRMEFATRMEDDNLKWTWAKICFGLFSRDLLNRMQSSFGRYFYGIVPDHDSAMGALMLSDKGLYLNSTLQISIVTTIGTGVTTKIDSSVTRRFLELCDPNMRFVDNYPIPRVWASQHNTSAYGYQLALDKVANPDLKINLQNLARRTAEDLAQIKYWTNLEERVDHYRSLWASELELGIWKEADGRLGY